MLRSMKIIAPVLLAVGIATCMAQTADVKTNAGAVAKIKALSPDERGQYADLIRQELEASIQVKLLSALADEFRTRATEPQPKAMPEKAKWQAELAQEFRDRSSSALNRLNGLTKGRLAFESDHGAPPAPASILGALGEAKPLGPDELAYVTKLDERVLKLREQMALVDEENKALVSQLYTNTTPEAVASVSALLDSNTKRARLLEWEEGEIELRKLQFRAMRKQ